MEHNQTATETAPVVYVAVEYRRPATKRHRARYVVHHQGREVEVIPSKGWERAEAYARAAAKVVGIEPEDLGTDYGFHRAVGWRWFTTQPGNSQSLPLALRGLGAPRR